MPHSVVQMIAGMIDFYNIFINSAKKLEEKETVVIAGDSNNTEHY